jgi:molybdenum cofactor cytidylyltransferase
MSTPPTTPRAWPVAAAGIASLGPEVEAVFVFLGDMPRTPPAVLAPLAEAVAAGAPAAAPVFQGRRATRWC